MDGLIQPRIGSLYQGVSRQAPLLRTPNQFEDLVNYLPSVDIGGMADRPGTELLQSLPASGYIVGGPHHYFSTTDGQRWLLLRTVSDSFEVRNWATGDLATLTVASGVLGYLANATDLRFLSIADTTIIVNPNVVVTANESARPALTTCYVVVRRVSTAQQAFTVQWLDGANTVSLAADNRASRESVAASLASGIISAANNDITAYVLGNAPYIVKITGTAAQIAAVSARCNWDESAVTLIKGRVTATAELPPAFEPGYPVAVDLGRGDKTSMYYVRYDNNLNAWIETSYLANDVRTAWLNPSTLPLRMRQITPTSFALDVCPWVDRRKGDSDSNPLPFFVGKRITAISTWKGRLALACQEYVLLSQADDLFNWFKETARESRAADPIELPCDAPGLTEVRHVIPFRNKLMVMADNAQLEISGDQALTPETAPRPGVATRYNLDRNCVPVVIGDSLYYTGISANRAALWEYYYDEVGASNTSFDLSKHVPGFILGKVTKIDGNAESGRVVMRAGPTNSLYVHTSYWSEGKRQQNAWTRLVFGNLTVRDFWIDENEIRMVATGGGQLWRLAMPMDTAEANEIRLDLRSTATASAISDSKSRILLPRGLALLGSTIVFAVVHQGDEWATEYTGVITNLGDGERYLDIPANINGATGVLGLRVERSFTFSPFYPSLGDTTTPEGRLQVRQVVMDMLKAGDLMATVTRKDRPPAVMRRSPRVLGADIAAPILGENFQVPVPFNARGDKATLTVLTTSTVPTTITGYTLKARYTNPFTEK